MFKQLNILILNSYYLSLSLNFRSSVLFVFFFLSDHVQSVEVDGKRSRPVDVVSGVPKVSVLGRLLFLLYTGDLPCLL